MPGRNEIVTSSAGPPWWDDHMRWGRAVTGSVVVLLAGGVLSGCGAQNGAAASCAGTSIDLGDSDLRPGGTVDLHVDWLYRDCEDTGGTFRASDDVTVTITPASTGAPVLLGRPTPTGEQFTVAGRFDLPDDLPVGDAVLDVSSHDGEGSGASLPVTISADDAG
ncbi:hypothetical protein ACQXVK_10735 [Curtobacterium sp. AB451]|uniref:hypothetical protein n=1 Tax=Curtobacterium sp. AB451 TaxID=3422306 RepID=UPI003D33A764